MRLIYFTRDYSPHDERFLNVLSKSVNEVYLLRLEGENLASRRISLPERITELVWKTSLQSRLQHRIEDLQGELAEIIQEVKPDLVHAGPLPDCAYLAALTGFRPLVGMSWGFDLMQDVDVSEETWKKAKKALAASGALLVDCQASAEKAARMGFLPARIVKFPWGVDLDHFSPGDGSELRRKLGWENNVVILCNRSWEPRYGVDVVLQAFFAAVQRYPELRLLLPGDGSLGEKFRTMIREADAEEVIFMPGRVGLNDLPGYYRTADLYASASHVDGSSVSLLEAMACGTPVAVSDIPANKEWVQDGVNGWVFPDGDAAALSRIMIDVCESKLRLSEMGVRNRKLMEEKADWKRNSPLLFKAYEMALEASR